MSLQLEQNELPAAMPLNGTSAWNDQAGRRACPHWPSLLSSNERCSQCSASALHIHSQYTYTLGHMMSQPCNPTVQPKACPCDVQPTAARYTSAITQHWHTLQRLHYALACTEDTTLHSGLYCRQYNGSLTTRHDTLHKQSEIQGCCSVVIAPQSQHKHADAVTKEELRMVLPS